MKRDFLIATDPFALSGKYPISYALVICRALLEWKNKENGTIDRMKALLDELQKVAQGEKEIFYEPSFLELYPFKKDSGIGKVLIDRTGGSWPLVFYPKDKDPDHKNRIDGLIKAIQSVNKEEVIEYIKSCPDWNMTTQGHLLSLQIDGIT